MKQPSPSFCVLAWNHLYTAPWGRPSLCCIATEGATDVQGRPLNLQTHSFAEIWNSPYYRNARRKMYVGERLEECRLCHSSEENGIRSYRQWANEYWLGQGKSAASLRKAIQRSARRDFEAESPSSFDLRLGNLCNLKCRMCSASFSSQIEKDPVHNGWRPQEEPSNGPHRFQGSVGGDWSESPELLDELKSLADRIESIQLAGGEPTINRTQTEWLRHLCETGRAERIALTVWTNLTNVHDEYFRMLSRFRSATLCLSVDGYGAGYEYIRFPAKWSEFEKNVRRAAAFPGIAMRVAPVLQAYNVLEITDLYRWADEHGLQSQMNPLDGPPYLRADVLPARARQLAAARLDAHVRALRARPSHDKEFADSLEGFGRQIIEPGYRASADMVRCFWEFTQELDNSRGQSFRASCPELFAFMTEGDVIRA